MNGLIDEFYRNFINESRWKLLLSGLGVTLEITAFALLLGVVLGFFVAIVRSAHDKTGKLGILNRLCTLYTTVIRGTPVVVQLGLNSGAYVSEIVRSGIMAIDEGQFEAGRSLGFSYAQTMWYIVMPQAFKNVLPALGNEFITLLKETSVSGYIAMEDLTKAGDIIRSRTFSPFMPLIAVAVIYLIMVGIFTRLLALMERRLRNSER